jgi:hypothetical protein
MRFIGSMDFFGVADAAREQVYFTFLAPVFPNCTASFFLDLLF